MSQSLSPDSHGPFRTWHSYLILLAILLLTAAAYFPVTSAGFITLDDPDYIYDAPHISTGLTPGNVLWAFTHPYRGFYIPLTWMSLQLDATLFGNDAGGYHVHNLLLHLVNVALVFFILRRCTFSPWQAAAPAVLWALHPLRVESVAWITERKDVLAGVFGFSAILIYLTFIAGKRRKTIWVVTLLFGLSLLAKPMFTTLPVLLLILDAFPLRRFEGAAFGTSLKPLLIEKIPLWAVALVGGLVTAIAHWRSAIIRDYPLDFRLSNAGVSYGRYLWKFISPADLGVYYPLPASAWPVGVLVSSLVAVLVLLAVAATVRRRLPALLAGVVFFLVALLPNIGLVQAWTQALADRFTYLPALGLSVALAGLIPACRGLASRVALVAVTAGLAILLSFMTYRQAELWQSPILLYEHTLAIKESAYLHDLVARGYAARAHDEEGELRLADVKLAIGHFRRALELDPASPDTQKYLNRLLGTVEGRERSPNATSP